MTVNDGIFDVNTVLLRLNVLLKRGYFLPDNPNVNDLSTLHLWLHHYTDKSLDLILFSDGLLVDVSPAPIGEDDKIRIPESNHAQFLEFTDSLPRVGLIQKAFSPFFRGGQ